MQDSEKEADKRTIEVEVAGVKVVTDDEEKKVEETPPKDKDIPKPVREADAVSKALAHTKVPWFCMF